MKRFGKMALGALMLAGATAAVATPAAARVSVGIGVGIPGPVYAAPYYGSSVYCDRYSRWYNPARCDAYYYDYYGPAYYPYYGPSFYFGGAFGGHGYHGGGYRGGGFHGGHRH